MPALDWTLLLRTPAFETTALLLGLVVGSFANVCIHRLPLAREPATGGFAWAIDLWRHVVRRPPAVALPAPAAPHPPADNVPIAGWLPSVAAAAPAAPRSRGATPRSRPRTASCGWRSP